MLHAMLQLGASPASHVAVCMALHDSATSLGQTKSEEEEEEFYKFLPANLQ